MTDKNFNDTVHDIIRDHAGYHQAYLAGILDAPLANAITALENTTPSCTGRSAIIIILNHVSRSLREAYGEQEYEDGLRLAHFEIHTKGFSEGTQLVLGEMENSLSATTEKIADKLTDTIKERVSKELEFNFWYGVTAGVIISVIAFLSYSYGARL